MSGFGPCCGLSMERPLQTDVRFGSVLIRSAEIVQCEETRNIVQRGRELTAIKAFVSGATVLDIRRS
jgi:hypothetical protein